MLRFTKSSWQTETTGPNRKGRTMAGRTVLPVAASETALVDPLSPKKPLRSEEVLGVGVGVR